MFKHVKFVHTSIHKAFYVLTIIALHSLGCELVMAQNTAAPGASSADISALQVDSTMILIEDVGPVGIGNDKDNLSLQSIDSFCMDIHEVTKGLWDEVRGWGLENGYPDLSEGTAGHEGDASHPVTEISWYDMVKWCNARSEMEGIGPVYFYQDGIFTRVYREGERLDLEIDASSGYRLPTEVEWEKAARGDQYANEEKTQGFDFPWGSNERTPQDANYGADGDHTAPVGSYPPNA